MAGAQRILAEFGYAEIGGLACNRDVGDEKSDLRRIDGQPGRLDIDDEIWPLDLAGFDAADQVLDTGGDTGPRLTAFLVADEGKGHVPGQRNAGLVEQ